MLRIPIIIVLLLYYDTTHTNAENTTTNTTTTTTTNSQLTHCYDEDKDREPHEQEMSALLGSEVLVKFRHH